MSSFPANNHELEQVDDLLSRLADAESRPGALSREVEHLQRLAMVGTLSAGIVHEVNNLLTPALAAAQMARLKPDEPDGLVRALERCIQSITQASRVAGTLIDFAGPGDGEDEPANPSGNGSHRPPAANIAQALKVTIACLGRAPGRPPVRIDTNVSPDAWVAIEPLALQQVFLNLLLNATRALAHTEDARIVVSSCPAEDGWMEVTIADNGPGIPPEIRGRIFEPFTSAAVGPRTEKGTGLGLTVSKRLLAMAGGSIAVGENRPLGAAFTIRLASICTASRAKSA